jgi:outer membrane lipoprotein-sorting protein
MKLPRTIFSMALPLVLLAGCGVETTQVSAHSQAPADHLTAVLAQMDAASQQFKNARADFTQDYYEAIVKDTTTEAGSIYFERKGTAMQMGAFMVDPKTKAMDKVYEYKDGLFRMLDAHIDQIRIVKPTSNQGQIETFLTLGMGASGKDLTRAWTITDQGPETLTDNGQPVKTEKLDLISKDPGVRNTLTHVTIWIDPARAVTLKQIFETPSHDRRTTVYSHIKLNTKIDAKAFELKKGSHTTVVGP